MSDQNVDVVVRAKDLTKEAFDKVQAALKQLENQSEETKKSAGGIGSHIKTGVAAFAGFAGGAAILGGIRSAFDFAKEAAFGMNATLESSTLQFGTLMGDTDKAREHVRGLFEFAKKTPFETGPIIEASKMMQTFGGDALNTKENLTLLGDASAATGAPIDQLGFWVGRLYSSVQAGKPFGEAAARLQELAVMSPQARDQMERMQKSGASAADVFKVFEGDLTKFTGAMSTQAGTWEGVTSSFSDIMNMMVADALRPFFEVARDALGVFNELMSSDAVTSATDGFAASVRSAFGENSQDTVRGMVARIIDFGSIGLTIADVIGRAWDGLNVVIYGLATGIVTVVDTAVGGILGLVNAASYVPGVGDSFKGVGEKVQWTKDMLSGLKDNLADQTAEAYEGVKGNSAYSQTIAEAQKVLGVMSVELSKTKGQQEAVTKATGAAGGAFRGQTGDADNLVGALARATSQVGHLTTAQKATLDAGIKTGASLKEMAKAAGITEEAVKLYKDQVKEAEQQQEKFNKLVDKFAKEIAPGVSVNARDITDAINEQVEAIRDRQGLIPTLDELPIKFGAGEESANLARAAMVEWTSTFQPFRTAVEDASGEIDKMRDSWEEAQRKSEAARKAMLDSLGNLSQAFANLSTSSGGSVSSLFETVGELIGQMNVAAQAGDAMSQGFDQMTSGGISNAIAGFTNLAAGAVAAAASIMEATDKASKSQRVLGGAAAGAQIGGSLAGGWGALIGAGVGALVGALRNPAWADVLGRVGRDWGITISEELARGIADTAGQMFRGDRQAAEIFHLGDILAEGGGLTDANYTKMLGKLRDVYAMVDMGKFKVEDARKVLDENFAAFAEHMEASGGVASQAFLDIVRLNNDMGTNSVEVQKFVSEQVKTGVQGIAAFLDNATVTTEAAAQGLVATVMVQFEEMRAGGASVSEALSAMGPVITDLDEQLKKAGFEGGEAMRELRELSLLAADEGVSKAVTAVGGLTSALVSTHNVGRMNDTMFVGLTGQIASTFNKLKAEGKDSGQLFALMQGDLQKIWELKTDFGYAVDDATAALLDEAAAAGVVGEAHRDPTQQMLRAMDSLTGAVQSLADLFGKTLPENIKAGVDGGIQQAGRLTTSFKDAIARIPREIDFQVNGHYNGPDVPGFSGGTPNLEAVDFGAESLVRLHNREHVVPEDRAIEFALRTLGRNGLTGGGGAQMPDIYLIVDNKGNTKNSTRAEAERVQSMLDSRMIRVPIDTLVSRVA